MRALPSRLGLRAERDRDRTLREHGGAGGGGAIERLLAWEPAAIARGVKIPAGGSILAVARAW
jgi:hypothetical protein